MPAYILPFEKMHGLGNDFVVVHHRYLPPDMSEPELARRLCDRRFGIGGDGLIVAKPAEEGGDFAWSYHNSNGSRGEMCGNGMRCLARYLFDRGIARTNQFTVETLAGLIEVELREDGQVTVDMASPVLEPSEIPVNAPQRYLANGFEAVSMGNPHAVKFLGSRQELQELDLQAAGQPVEMDTVTFPAMVNVEFAYVVSPREIDLRVWERGAGATLACGTGACATVVIAQLNDLVDTGQEIAVNLPGGTLLVRWLGEGSSVFMTGPAESVFVGQVELKI